MSSVPKKDKTLVLLGSGAAHLRVVTHLVSHPLPESTVIWIVEDAFAPIPTRIPAFFRGERPYHEAHEDLRYLARSAGITLVVGAASKIDFNKRTILFAQRPEIYFDVLSCDLDPTFAPDFPCEEKNLISASPMTELVHGFRKLISELDKFTPANPPRIGIYGHDKQAVELALVIREVVGRTFKDAAVELLMQGERLDLNFNDRAIRKLEDELEEHKVGLHPESIVTDYRKGVLSTAERKTRNFDYLFWCTSRQLPTVLQDLQLNKGPYIPIDAYMCVRGLRHVFATSTLGVYDGRKKPETYDVEAEAETLMENLRRAISGSDRLVKTTFSNVEVHSITLSRRRALTQWGSLSFAGYWGWWLRQRLEIKHSSKIKSPPLRDSAGSSSWSVPTVVTFSPECMERWRALFAMRGKKCELTIEPFIDHLGLKATKGAYVNSCLIANINQDPFLMAEIATKKALECSWIRGCNPDLLDVVVQFDKEMSLDHEVAGTWVLSGVHAALEDKGGVALRVSFEVGERLQVKVTSLAALKPKSPQWTLQSVVGGESLILTEALGSGSALESLLLGEEPSPGLERWLRSAHFVSAKLTKLAKRKEVKWSTPLYQRSLMESLLYIAQMRGVSSTVNLEHLQEYALSAKALLSSTSEKVQRVSEKALRKNGTWTRWAEIWRPQVCSGHLLIVQSQAEDIVLNELREMGYHDAHVIGNLQKDRGEVIKVYLS